MLWQYQCQTQKHFFYYLWGGEFPPAMQVVERCPICGTKRVEMTGRSYPEVDEHKPTPQERRLRANNLRAELLDVFCDERLSRKRTNGKEFREWVQDASDNPRHTFQKVATEYLELLRDKA